MLTGAVVLAPARAGGRVLGAGEGAAVELAVFAATGAGVVGAGFAALLAGAGSFACTSFASWDVEGGLFGGRRGCLGTWGSCGGSDSGPGWLLDEPCLFFGSSAGTGFLRLDDFGASSSWLAGLPAPGPPMGTVWPFFSAGGFSFSGSSPSCSGSSNRTPLFTSSSLGFRIEIFRSKTSEVSLNLSLLFFFLHFQGLKILPKLENLLFLLVGGVVSPDSRTSTPMPASLGG